MFNFTFSVSGGYNPFSAQKGAKEYNSPAPGPPRKLPPPPKRPLPPRSISEDVNLLSKKRGWAPSNSAVSEPISQPTLTSGWIDTPSRYLEAAAQTHRGDDDQEADLPPAKRRRTFADSIISTAFSAALIGTAVGMTAYRMWRDRGKPTGQGDSESVEPPPPYEREEWVDEASRGQPASRPVRHPRRSRNPTRRTPRHRTNPIAIPSSRSVVRDPSSSRSAILLQGQDNIDDKTELDDQMDWMGEKIRNLIEEGQRALGREIVVMDDGGCNEGGAVDDGMEGWEELDQADPSSPASPNHRRQRRRPWHPSDNKLSPSLPTRASLGVSASYSDIPASSRLKRSRIPINSAGSQTSSSYPDLRHMEHPSYKTDSATQDIKVIYESVTNPSDFASRVERDFEDEDSRGLAECMANVRKVYRIH